MFITEYEVKTALAIYLVLFIASILVAVYNKNLSFKDRIFRIILIVFLPLLGILITLIEGLIHFIKSKRGNKNVAAA